MKTNAKKVVKNAAPVTTVKAGKKVEPAYIVPAAMVSEIDLCCNAAVQHQVSGKALVEVQAHFLKVALVKPLDSAALTAIADSIKTRHAAQGVPDQGIALATIFRSAHEIQHGKSATVRQPRVEAQGAKKLDALIKAAPTVAKLKAALSAAKLVPHGSHGVAKHNAGTGAQAKTVTASTVLPTKAADAKAAVLRIMSAYMATFIKTEQADLVDAFDECIALLKAA